MKVAEAIRELQNFARFKTLVISSPNHREQKAEEIESIEFVEQLNAVVIFTKKEGE